MSNLPIEIIYTIIANSNFSTEYQPIIDIKTMDIYAYEALARFSYKGQNIPPNIVFESCHDNEALFFLLESRLKYFQIEHRPKKCKLFLNLDPDICVKEYQIEFWVEFLSSHSDITIEIIENADEENIENVKYFMEWLKEYKLPFAYDDFGKDNSIFFAELLQQACVIKLDISFLRRIKQDPAYLEYLKGTINYARASGKKSVLEGVETEEDLKLAKGLGIDFVQGFLFKDQFIQAGESLLKIA